MKTLSHSLKILIFSGCLFLAAVPSVLAAVPAGPSAEVLALLDLINAARQNLSETAAAMGMDTATILAAFPDQAQALSTGMAPLRLDGPLTQSAADHTKDMIAAGYYSSVSPDGAGPYERAGAAGYAPDWVDENLAIIGFANPMSPSDAAKAVFKSLLAVILRQATGSGGLGFLNPAAADVGIGIEGGRITIGQHTFNGYVVSVDFGVSRVSLADRELLELINQARQMPLAVARQMGIDTQLLVQQHPGMAVILNRSLPPVTFNSILFQTAEARASQIFKDPNLADYPGPDTGPAQLAAAGYKAALALEAVGLKVTVTPEDPVQLAVAHFRTLLAQDLAPDVTERKILNPAVSEVGIVYRAVDPAGSNEIGGPLAGFYDFLLVSELAQPQTPGPAHVTGHVWQDADGDGLYDPGEGNGNVTVVFEKDGVTQNQVMTNQAGGFVVSLDPGTYRCYLAGDEADSALDLVVAQQNIAVNFKIEEPTGN